MFLRNGKLYSRTDASFHEEGKLKLDRRHTDVVSSEQIHSLKLASSEEEEPLGAWLAWRRNEKSNKAVEASDDEDSSRGK